MKGYIRRRAGVKTGPRSGCARSESRRQVELEHPALTLALEGAREIELPDGEP